MEHLNTFTYVDMKLQSSNKTSSKLNVKKLPACSKIYILSPTEIFQKINLGSSVLHFICMGSLQIMHKNGIKR